MRQAVALILRANRREVGQAGPLWHLSSICQELGSIGRGLAHSGSHHRGSTSPLRVVVYSILVMLSPSAGGNDPTTELICTSAQFLRTSPVPRTHPRCRCCRPPGVTGVVGPLHDALSRTDKRKFHFLLLCDLWGVGRHELVGPGLSASTSGCWSKQSWVATSILPSNGTDLQLKGPSGDCTNIYFKCRLFDPAVAATNYAVSVSPSTLVDRAGRLILSPHTSSALARSAPTAH